MPAPWHVGTSISEQRAQQSIQTFASLAGDLAALPVSVGAGFCLIY
jgi:hypothetical protein